jgi:hypothetical protein
MKQLPAIDLLRAVRLQLADRARATGFHHRPTGRA